MLLVALLSPQWTFYVCVRTALSTWSEPVFAAARRDASRSPLYDARPPAHTSTLGCVTAGQLFGWEFIISFILVSTVYACAIGAPNFGESACSIES